MGKPNWTTGQQNAIVSRGGSVLVSAAAGSGKTTVLVERVIGRIIDPENPVDIDRMLIVTYTNAAAAEMRGRLSKRLGERIAENPEDARLQRQQMLLPTAHISTIHGFCGAFLREHFDKAGISPRFRIAEDTETVLLKKEALEETLEVFYAEGDESFLKLSDLLNGRRDDAGIQKAVLETFDAFQAQAFPMEWLKSACVPEDANLPIGQTRWGKTVREFVSGQLSAHLSLMKNALAPLCALPEAAGYYTVLNGFAGLLEQAVLTLSDPENDWDTCIRTLQNAVFDRLPSSKGIDKYLVEGVKFTFGGYKKAVTEKLLPLFSENEKTATRGVQETLPKLQAFCRVMELFAQRYAAKKQARQILDFNDLEHKTLALLCDKETGLPTPLAKETAKQFTEIFVDEYQDTNTVQDTIFKMLSCDQNSSFYVGDVKQSIYGFRLAMPEIFMEKKEAFAPFDGKTFPATIALAENFRSRKEVTGAVNFVFKQLMTKGFCGIEYDDSEQLVASASYPETEDCATELLLCDNPFSEKEMPAYILEARLIATRIKELLETGSVTENGKPRPVKYGDICILMRNRGVYAAHFAAEMNRLGIPTEVDTGTPFFESTDVQTALSLLRVLDNPLRDIPLMSLLVSPVGGFSPDDCAKMRILAKKEASKTAPLYTGLTLTANSQLPIREKAEKMLTFLQYWRREAVTISVHQLVSRMLDHTGLLAAAAAGVDGDVRVNNLRQLLQYARRFEQNGFKGLSGFVRWIDRLEQEKKDVTAAAPPVGGDTVSIMTIHGSKGLEFPVVFLARLFKEFHKDTSAEALVRHNTAGVALKGYDQETFTTFPTVSQSGVLISVQQTSLAEELRVLYVAMTRAREKLICVFSRKNLLSRLEKLAHLTPNTETVDTHRLLMMGSFSDWLLCCFLRHPDGTLLRHLAGTTDVITLDELSPLTCREMDASVLAEMEAKDASKATHTDTALYETLKERLAFSYPFARLEQVPAKIAASILASQQQGDTFVAVSRPGFLSEQGLTPADKGTALHTFMEFADFEKAKADVATEAKRLFEQEFLTKEQWEALDTKKITGFFCSSLYARIQKAQRVWREYEFTAPLSVTDYDATLPEQLHKETLIVQGVADCVFIEDGQLVIVDYKTDRAHSANQLKERYQKQLEIYRDALSKTLEMPVKETLLYSFHLGEAIPV